MGRYVCSKHLKCYFNQRHKTLLHAVSAKGDHYILTANHALFPPPSQPPHFETNFFFFY